MRARIPALVAAVGLTVLTSLSARPWSEIQSSGELRVAIRVRDGVMNKDQQSGLHYDLIRQFAKENGGLKIKVVLKDKLGDYFDGSVFKTADVVVDNVTITDDRAAKMDFVEVFPVRQILVTMKGHTPIRRNSQLQDETIIVAKDSSYEATVAKIEKDGTYVFKYFKSANTADQLKDLADGKGTVTVLDSNLAAGSLQDSKIQLHGGIGPKQMVGWGAEKGNKAFTDKLNAFLNKANKDKSLDKIWDKYIEGLTYQDYLTLAQ